MFLKILSQTAQEQLPMAGFQFRTKKLGCPSVFEFFHYKFLSKMTAFPMTAHFFSEGDKGSTH